MVSNMTVNPDPERGAKLEAAEIAEAAAGYVELLTDLDELVNTDTAFQVGGWIEQAKKLAVAQPGTDCTPALHFTRGEIADCAHFYEWNARVQITSWDPTPKGAAAPGRETIDYASKHWAGIAACIAQHARARIRAISVYHSRYGPCFSCCHWNVNETASHYCPRVDQGLLRGAGCTGGESRGGSCEGRPSPTRPIDSEQGQG